eukprot:jgi/Mesen1/401/ME000010S_10855
MEDASVPIVKRKRSDVEDVASAETKKLRSNGSGDRKHRHKDNKGDGDDDHAERMEEKRACKHRDDKDGGSKHRGSRNSGTRDHEVDEGKHVHLDSVGEERQDDVKERAVGDDVKFRSEERRKVSDGERVSGSVIVPQDETMGKLVDAKGEDRNKQTADYALNGAPQRVDLNDTKHAFDGNAGAVQPVVKAVKRSRWDKDVKGDVEDDRGEKRKREVAGTVKDGGPVGSHGNGSGIAAAGGAGISTATAALFGVTATGGGTASGAPGGTSLPKAGGLTLEALAKVKLTLQKHKELQEKLKKMPQVSKPAGTPPAPAPASEAPPAAPGPAASEPSTSSATAAAGVPGLVPGGGFPGAMPGLLPGMMPGMQGMQGMQGFMPGMMTGLNAYLNAEMARRMGIQAPPGGVPGMGYAPAAAPAAAAQQEAQKKPPRLKLDAQGRLVDEEGNVMEEPKTGPMSTLKVNINKQKKEAFKILRPELEEDPQDNPFYDPRMGSERLKLVRPRKASFQFVEEGQWTRQAEGQRFRAQFGEAKAKELRVKQAAMAKAKDEDVNPNLIAVGERAPADVKEEKPLDPIPDVEWWDAVLLPSKSYGNVQGDAFNIREDKITLYVEHPVPIEPPAEAPPPPPQPLKLTKSEQKKLRTQRRLAREKERQEMIRQGLMEPPKAKIKMSNLMRVLGTQAVQDPTKLEREVRTAAAEREQAHVDRNLARKLTPAEKREKKERKLFDDPHTVETVVSVYRVGSLAHPQTRFKVDINAQENHLSGCVVISDDMTVVVVEGVSKAIKRYSKLMLKRINWATAVEDDKDEDAPEKTNSCVLVWQGSVARPSFERFTIHQCRTAAAARKHMADAGVGHYWDLAINFPSD